MGRATSNLRFDPWALTVTASEYDPECANAFETETAVAAIESLPERAKPPVIPSSKLQLGIWQNMAPLHLMRRLLQVKPHAPLVHVAEPASTTPHMVPFGCAALVSVQELTPAAEQATWPTWHGLVGRQAPPGVQVDPSGPATVPTSRPPSEGISGIPAVPPAPAGPPPVPTSPPAAPPTPMAMVPASTCGAPGPPGDAPPPPRVPPAPLVDTAPSGAIGLARK